MLRIAIAAACALTLLTGCGDDDAEGGASAGTGDAARLAADLTVIVRPEGPGGPARRRRVRCEDVAPQAEEPACRRLTAARLAPVPPTTPCTAIYGGPNLARVTGTLRGEPVDARFSLEDGCEIERWDRNRSLLGPH
jgi:hypothetical protein